MKRVIVSIIVLFIVLFSAVMVWDRAAMASAFDDACIETLFTTSLSSKFLITKAKKEVAIISFLDIARGLSFEEVASMVLQISALRQIFSKNVATRLSDCVARNTQIRQYPLMLAIQRGLATCFTMLHRASPLLILYLVFYLIIFLYFLPYPADFLFDF